MAADEREEGERALAQVQGAYAIEFARYAQVPPPVQQKLAASFKLYGGPGGLASVLPLQWTDLIVVAPCPVVAALIAAVTARGAALAQLGAQT